MKTKTGFDPESNMPQQLSAGEKKVAEYADRIRNGEDVNKVLEGLPDAFKSGVEKRLGGYSGEVNQDVIPPQYVGLNSEVVDFMWTVPEYVDPEKTKRERDRKAAAISILKERESKIDHAEESRRIELEEAQKIKNELVGQQENGKDVFSEFRMKNGETKTNEGFYWNEYRNQIAKDLKEEGKLEWGKERIYFDIAIKDCEKLKNLAIKIASEQKIPVAFKFPDVKKTLPIHMDGTETRFVTNFASEDDAKRFYDALKNAPEYAALKLSSDRKLDYKGIRIDDIAEYASGYREVRAGLSAVMSATEQPDGTYAYIGATGKKMRIPKDEYDNFKQRFDELKIQEQKTKERWGVSDK